MREPSIFEYSMFQVAVVMLIYFILTAPMLGYILFDYGFRYTTIQFISCLVIANIAGAIITNKYFKKWN